MGHLINIVPGEDIDAPALIYFDSIDGRAFKASSLTRDNPSTGIVLVDCVEDVPNQAYLDGVVDYSAGEFAAGTPLYLGTDGAIVTTPPANVQRVGAHIDLTQSVFSFQGFEPIPGVSEATAKKLAFLRV